MPTLKKLADRAERTNVTAAATIEAERLAREKKTARLREMRLAKEAGEVGHPKTRRGR
jgi:hypothetical protein